MLKYPARVRSKSLPTPQGQLMEKEDPTISDDESVELRDLAVIGEEGKDN